MLLNDLSIYRSLVVHQLWGVTTSKSLVSNLVFHARSKHVEVDYHFVSERTSPLTGGELARSIVMAHLLVIRQSLQMIN